VSNKNVNGAVIHFLILSKFITSLNGYRICSDHACSINEDNNPDNHLLWSFQQENMHRRRRLNPKADANFYIDTGGDKVGLDIKYINAFKGKLNVLIL